MRNNYTACKYFFKKVQWIPGALHRSLAQVLWVLFDTEMVYVKWGSAVLDPHMTLNVTTTSLWSHHVDASPCLGSSLWQAWGVLRCVGLSGLTLLQRMGWGTHHPTGKNLYPFYSINVSWSNVSYVCTCLDFLWIWIQLKACSPTNLSRIVCKHKAWSSFCQSSVVAIRCSMWKMKGWLAVPNTIHSFCSSFNAEGFHDFVWSLWVVKVTFRHIFLGKYSVLIAGTETMSFWCCSPGDCLSCLLCHIYRVTFVLWA